MSEIDKKPDIRFKGFFNQWEKSKLGDFGNSTGGTSIESEFIEGGKYKVISIGSYSEESTYNDQGIRCKLSEKTKKRILKKNDLTMILNDKTSSGRIIGRALLIDSNDLYVFNQRTERIEPHHDKFDSTFLYQMLNAPMMRDKIYKQSQGNTQIFVNWSSIEQTEYFVPEKEEQKQIAIFFEKIDNLIKLYKNKRDTLVNVRKAMLEKMFPINGKKTPEIRFKGFSDEWNQRKLGEETTEIVAGGDINNDLLLDEGKYPVLANALTNEGVVGYYKENYRISAPAVTITARGDVGHAKARKVNFTPVVRLLSIKTNHDVDFFENAINTLKIVVESTGVPQLTVPQIEKYQICFPKSIDEEQAIGKIFLKIDNLINLYQHKIEKLKNIKDACLNKMFI